MAHPLKRKRDYFGQILFLSQITLKQKLPRRSEKVKYSYSLGGEGVGLRKQSPKLTGWSK